VDIGLRKQDQVLRLRNEVRRQRESDGGVETCIPTGKRGPRRLQGV